MSDGTGGSDGEVRETRTGRTSLVRYRSSPTSPSYRQPPAVASSKHSTAGLLNSVPSRLGKGQGAKEIGHNLARERQKFGHNLVRKRRKIFYG